MVFLIHHNLSTGLIDIFIAIVWGVAAAFYFLAMRRNTPPVRRILRPIRMVGMFISLAWSAYYWAIYFDILNSPTSTLEHQILDGLILSTAFFLIGLNVSGTRLFKNMGVE